MSCTTCKTKTCTCKKSTLPVMPPTGCNEPDCADPNLCPEVISTECIVYLGDAISCGDDEVVATGSTLQQVHESIVTYFCTRLTQAQEDLQAASVIVTEVSCGEDVVYETGDNIIEALEKTVGYFCTGLEDINTVITSLATVATTGAYSDLSGVPSALSDFTNDLLTADELAAINGANTPTTLNPFATISDIPTLTSELTNDSGFLTSSTNLGNSDLTLTANRVVTGGGFSLSFTAVDLWSSQAEAHTIKNITGNNNVLHLTTPATFGSNFIQFGRNNINNNCGQIYSSDQSINIQYNTGNVISSVFANGFKVGNNGAVPPIGRLEVVSPSASSLDTAFAVRNNTDTSNHFYVRADGRIFAIQTLEAVQGINISSGNLNFGLSNFIISGTTGTVEMQAYNSNTIKLNPLVNDVWITSHNKFYSGGGINFPSVQVGNATLVAGDLYFDTAANILANGDLVCGRKV